MSDTSLQPQFNWKTGAYDYIEVPEHIPAWSINFKRFKDGVAQTINGVSETVAGCIWLSYDMLDSLWRIVESLPAGYCKLIGVDKPVHIEAISNLGLGKAPDVNK